jgi:hypothetical protein
MPGSRPRGGLRTKLRRRRESFEPEAQELRGKALEKLAKAMLPHLVELAKSEAMLEASRDPVETDRPGDVLAGCVVEDVGQRLEELTAACK